MCSFDSSTRGSAQTEVSTLRWHPHNTTGEQPWSGVGNEVNGADASMSAHSDWSITTVLEHNCYNKNGSGIWLPDSFRYQQPNPSNPATTHLIPLLPRPSTTTHSVRETYITATHGENEVGNIGKRSGQFILHWRNVQLIGVGILTTHNIITINRNRPHAPFPPPPPPRAIPNKPFISAELVAAFVLQREHVVRMLCTRLQHLLTLHLSVRQIQHNTTSHTIATI